MYQIFVVEDELLIRQSIRGLVENMGGPYAFCGEASDGEMALAMMQDLMPDIMLTDIKMPFLDGFELIRHAKAMMPWLKIIIISGYDEFESAQRAISLGVDLYLLKPIKAADLTAAIEKVAIELEQSRRADALPTGYTSDELQHALYQHFMQQLLFTPTPTSQLLSRASSLKLEMVHPYYQIVLFHFDVPAHWQQRAMKLLNDERAALYYFGGSEHLALLNFAKTKEVLNENTYRLINIIRHELGFEGMPITTLVGSVVERISLIREAYAAAEGMLKKLQPVCTGQIIDINDTPEIASDFLFSSIASTERFGQSLMHAAAEDVPALLENYWNEIGNDALNSMLYRYHTLMDLLKTTVKIVASARTDASSRDIAAQLSNTYDIFNASAKRETFESTALDILLSAVRMKQASSGAIKHSSVITRAEEYIAQEFCDPNISLISVAKHVNMSSAHFSTVFSQTMGKTFISHLTSLRIEKAKQLLSQTDMKLAAIAMEIGYNEPNYFSLVFKKNEGITPKEYRSKFSALLS